MEITNYLSMEINGGDFAVLRVDDWHVGTLELLEGCSVGSMLRPTLFETGILILGETARFAKGAHLSIGMDGGFGLERELGFRAQLAGGV